MIMINMIDLSLSGDIKLNQNLVPSVWWISPTKSMGPYGSMYRPSRTIEAILKAESNIGTVVYTFESGILPEGLEIDPEGRIVGTATAPDGVYVFTVRASAGPAYADKELKLVLGEVPPPVWITEPFVLDDMAYVNQPYEFQLEAIDEFDLPVFYTLVGGSLPPGLFLNYETGVIQGTLAEIQQDTIYTFTVAATNLSSAANRVFQIYATQVPPENAPVWITPSGILIEEPTYETMPFDFQLEATDPVPEEHEGTLEYVLLYGSLPDGLVIDSATGMISGNLPNVPDNTTFSFVVGARTPIWTTPRMFRIKVEFVIVPNMGFGVDGEFDFGPHMEETAIPDSTYRVYSEAPSQLPVTYSIVGLQAYPEIVYDNLTGWFSGTMPIYPSEEEVEDNHMDLPFAVTATNGIKSVTVNGKFINERNLPPVFVGPTNLMTDLEMTPLGVMPSPIAYDPNGYPITVTLEGDLPDSIQFDYENLTFTGSLPPAPDHDVIVNVTLTANDGKFEVSKDYNFVSWLNTPPVWVTPTGNQGATIEGFPISFEVSAYDPQLRPVTYSLIDGPVGATVDSSTGLVQVSNIFLSDPELLTEELYFTVAAFDGVFYTNRTFSYTIEKDIPPEWITPEGHVGTALGMKSFSFSWQGTSNNTGQGIRYYIANAGNIPAFGELSFRNNGISGKFPNTANTNENWEEQYNFTIGLYDVDAYGVEIPNRRVERDFYVINHYNNTPVWIDTIDNTNSGNVVTRTPTEVVPSSMQPLPEWQSTEYLSTVAGGAFGMGEDVCVILYASNGMSYAIDHETSNSLTQSGLSFYAHHDDYFATLDDPEASPVFFQVNTIVHMMSNTNAAIVAGIVGKNPQNISNYFDTEFSFDVTAYNEAGERPMTFKYHIDNTTVLYEGIEKTGVSYKFGESENPFVDAIDYDGQNVRYYYSSVTSELSRDGNGRVIRIDQNSGSITGTLPEASTDRTVGFTLQAYDQTESIDDGFYYRSPRSFRIISRYNKAPVWSGSSTLGKVQNAFYERTFTATNLGSADRMRFWVVGGQMPPNFSMDDTGYFRGVTHTVEDEDVTYSFVVRVSNGIKYTDRTVTFTIYAAEEPEWDTIGSGTGAFFRHHGNANITTSFSGSSGDRQGTNRKLIVTDKSQVPDYLYFQMAERDIVHYAPLDNSLTGSVKENIEWSMNKSDLIYDDGKFGKALRFDGTVWGKLQPELVGPFTIEALVRPLSFVGDQTIFKFGAMTVKLINHKIVMAHNGETVETVQIQPNEWYHVAVSKTGSTIRLALDGQYIGHLPDVNISIEEYLYIGAENDAGTNPLNAIVDETVVKKSAAFTFPTKPDFIANDKFFYNINYHSYFDGNLDNYGTGLATFVAHGAIEFVQITPLKKGLYLNDSYITGDAVIGEQFTIEIRTKLDQANQDSVLFDYGDFCLKYDSGNVVFESKGSSILEAPVNETEFHTITLSKSEKYIYLAINDVLVDYIYTNPRVVYSGNEFSLGASLNGSSKTNGTFDYMTLTLGVSTFKQVFSVRNYPVGNDVTGLITGYFPLYQTDQHYTFDAIIVDNIYSSPVRNFLMINEKDKPPIFTTGEDLGEYIERTPLNIPIVAYDIEDYPITYRLVSSDMPPSMYFDEGTGRLLGTAAEVDGSMEQFHFTVEANDSNHVTTRDFFIDVEFNYPPEWDTAQGEISNTFGGETIGVSVVATDRNQGTNLIYELIEGELPEGVEFQNGLFSGNTNAITAPTAKYTTNVSVTDGYNTIYGEFVLSVKQNRPPEFTPTGRRIAEGWEQTIVKDADYDPPYIIRIVEPNETPLEVSVVAPDWVTYDVSQTNTTATVSITNIELPATIGIDDLVEKVSITATDSIFEVTEDYEIYVKYNMEPVWITPTVLPNAQESSEVEIQLEAISNGLPVFYTMVSSTMVGATLDVGTGVLKWMTPAVFEDTNFYISIIASTGIKFSQRDFVLKVVRNWPPQWLTENDLGEFNEQQNISLELVAIDPNGTQVTYTPSNIYPVPYFFTDVDMGSPNNSVILTGRAPFVDEDTTFRFTIGAMDSYHLVERNFSLKVIGTEPPVWISNTNLGDTTEGELFSATMVAEGFEGRPVTYSLDGAIPAGLSLTSSGLLSGTVPIGTYNTVTNVSIRVKATDNIGKATVQTHTLSIIPKGLITLTSPTGTTIYYTYGAKINLTQVGEWTLHANVDTPIHFKAWGASGGGSRHFSPIASGGNGGFAAGTNFAKAGDILKIMVGAGGITQIGNINDRIGGGGGILMQSIIGGSRVGSGGGMAGIFEGSILRENALLIAGGGAGGAGGRGGHGGGYHGIDGVTVGTGTGGAGGNQNFGGAGSQGAARPLMGGRGVEDNTSGGGGGYYGGSAGGGGNRRPGASAGGGSGYTHPTKIIGGQLVAGSDAGVANSSDPDYISPYGQSVLGDHGRQGLVVVTLPQREETYQTDPHYNSVQLLVQPENATILDTSNNLVGKVVDNVFSTTEKSLFTPRSIKFDNGLLCWPSVGMPSYTIEFWMFADPVLTTPQYLFMNGRPLTSTPASSYAVRYNPTDMNIQVYTKNSIGSIYPDTPMYSLLPNRWNHVAVVKETNGVVSIFINGVKNTSVNALSGSPAFGGHNNLNIANYPPNNQQTIVWGAYVGNNTVQSPFNGFMTGLRITNGVARYTTNFIPAPYKWPTQ